MMSKQESERERETRKKEKEQYRDKESESERPSIPLIDSRVWRNRGLAAGA